MWNPAEDAAWRSANFVRDYACDVYDAVFEARLTDRAHGCVDAWRRAANMARWLAGRCDEMADRFEELG